MKYLILCAVIPFVVGVGEFYAHNGYIFTMGTRVAISSRATPTCTKGGAECSADCTVLMLCAAGDATPLATSPCSSPTQYCVGSACTGTPADSCTAGPTFPCTSDGLFPDPENCTKYWECVAGTATLYECPVGFVYDSLVDRCAASTARTVVPAVPCNKLDCSKKPNGFLVYPGNPAYYAYCALETTGKITTYMFKCDYPTFQIFDLVSNQCIYDCKASGYYQDPADCNGYYYCSAAKANPIRATCTPTYVFDGVGCNKDATTCKYP